MEINDSSNVIEFNFDATKKDIMKILPDGFSNIIDDVVMINGEYYHSKLVTSREMINELIGSFYSKQVGLDAVDYKIGICEGKVYALSKIFFKPGFSYVYPHIYFERRLAGHTHNTDSISPNMYEIMFLNRLNNTEAINSVLKMTAVDLKMNQIDRHSYNVLFRIKNGTVFIEKVFDFACAYGLYKNYSYSDFFYENPFLMVSKDVLTLSKFAIEYPLFSKSATILSEIQVTDALKEIEKTFNVKISDNDFIYYKEKDEEYSKLLKLTL